MPNELVWKVGVEPTTSPLRREPSTIDITSRLKLVPTHGIEPCSPGYKAGASPAMLGGHEVSCANNLGTTNLIGAGEEFRNLNLHFGKVMLYF